MKIRFEELSGKYGKEFMSIFNYYIENSAAAFPEKPLPDEFMGVFLNISKGYPAFVVLDDDENARMAGFGFLHAYNPMSTFSQTAEITYFLHHDYTGKKIGSALFDRLVAGAKGKGITTILASISSKNEGSIRFHARKGFSECGRFASAGKKNGAAFDVVWMQKIIG